MRNTTYLLALLTVAAFATSANAAASLATPCCEPVCCDKPCIRYIDKTCGPKVQTVLLVKHPCTCCDVEIPLCVPACLSGEPCIIAKCGAMGRGKVIYKWCDGFIVKVIFDKCGDITVVSVGR